MRNKWRCCGKLNIKSEGGVLEQEGWRAEGVTGLVGKLPHTPCFPPSLPRFSLPYN